MYMFPAVAFVRVHKGYKAIKMGHLMRLELTRVGLLYI